MRLTLPLIALALLAGCATMPGGGDARQAEMARLEADCTARNGILVAIPGATNAREAANFTCNIQDSASRIQR